MRQVLVILVLLICFPLWGQDRPNILWITCEDISPFLGSYGFEKAQTPNLDRMANGGVRFTKAYANAPVCGVARSTLLTGMYAPTLGTHNFRTRTQLPSEIPAYPKLLRKAGYFCTNNYKTDYNSSFQNDNELWDESSKTAHYDNRKPDQPFFSVFNLTTTHESQLAPDKIDDYVQKGLIPEQPRIDPDSITLPAYHPDTKETRRDWARFHDLITLMDQQVGQLLDDLKKRELEDNTIIFFYSDHGGMLSRSKRYLFNTGTQVPLIIHFPEKWKHLSKVERGGVNDQLVSFIDFPKTLLSILGCPIPDKMQGRVFLGNHMEPESKFVYFYRDRMSERYDCNRAITDGRYYLIQNFNPHRPRGRSTRYGYKVQANWRENEKFFESGQSDPIQSQFYRPKPLVELFDTRYDSLHIENKAELNPNHDQLKRLSKKLDQWMIDIKDIGLIPEPMFKYFAGAGKPHRTIYEYAQSESYNVETVLEKAKLAASGQTRYKEDYLELLKSSNPILRYWGCYGLFLIAETDEGLQTAIENGLKDEKVVVNRMMLAQTLAASGKKEKAFAIIFDELLRTEDGYDFLFGLNAIQYGHMDDLMTKKDWYALEDQRLSISDKETQFGIIYSERIISDALSLWPRKRKVD